MKSKFLCGAIFQPYIYIRTSVTTVNPYSLSPGSQLGTWNILLEAQPNTKAWFKLFTTNFHALLEKGSLSLSKMDLHLLSNQAKEGTSINYNKLFMGSLISCIEYLQFSMGFNGRIFSIKLYQILTIFMDVYFGVHCKYLHVDHN